MKQVCSHCGASMETHWHKLTPGLVKVLTKFSKALKDKGVNNLNVSKECDLSNAEYNNFQKLRYHGLVAKYKEHDKHIAGHWVLTRRGLDFLRGTLSVPDSVETFRNRVINYSDQEVNIYQVTGDHFETIETIKHGVVQQALL